MAQIPPDCRRFKPATRERVRRAIATTIEGALRADKKVISVSVVMTAQGGGDQNATTALLRAWRGGLSIADSWEDVQEAGEAPKRNELVEAITAATTREQVAAVARMVSAKVAAGELDAAAGRVILEGLERQLPPAPANASGPAEDDQGVDDDVDLERQRATTATDDGLELARAFDLFVSDERRRKVMEYITAEALADVAEHPNTDAGGLKGKTT